MNKITQDSEKGFQQWLDYCGWRDDGDDYYINVNTQVSRDMGYLHGLFIAEQNFNTYKDADRL